MTTAAALLREARMRAGLSQRDLAKKAGTAQSVIARIERGQTSPTLETLERLLAAAGVELHASLAVKERDERSHMLDDVPRIAHHFRLQFEQSQSAWVLLYPEGMVKLGDLAFGELADPLRRLRPAS